LNWIPNDFRQSAGVRDPVRSGFSRLLRDLELNGTLRVLLHGDCPSGDMIAVGNTAHA